MPGSCKKAAARKPARLHAWTSFEPVCARLNVLEAGFSYSRADGSLLLLRAYDSTQKSPTPFVGCWEVPVTGRGATGQPRGISGELSRANSLPHPLIGIVGTCFDEVLNLHNPLNTDGGHVKSMLRSPGRRPSVDVNTFPCIIVVPLPRYPDPTKVALQKESGQLNKRRPVCHASIVPRHCPSIWSSDCPSPGPLGRALKIATSNLVNLPAVRHMCGQ